LGSMYLCRPVKETVEEWRTLLRGGVSPAFADLREALEEISLESEREMEDLLWDYTKLFIGPYKLPCPPWESVYMSPKKLMMQEPYDEVLIFYREAGLSIGDPNVHVDHVGAELSFLSVLYGKMENEPEGNQRYKEMAERFLGEHLKRWIFPFTADMESAAVSRFYKALARATRELVAAV